MVKKKSENDESFIQKHGKKIGFTITVLITSFIVYASWLVLQKNFIQKEVVNNYVCQILGSDPDSGILAMRCVVK